MLPLRQSFSGSYWRMCFVKTREENQQEENTESKKGEKRRVCEATRPSEVVHIS